MGGCTESDWWIRATVHNVGGRTPCYITSENVGWDGRFGNGPAHGERGYEELTLDVYPRNGSFVPVSNYGPDKDIRQYCGFWRIWFYIWCINAGPYQRWTVLTSCVGRDGRRIRIQIGWNSWWNIWRCSRQAAPAPRTSYRPPRQFSPTVSFPSFRFFTYHHSHLNSYSFLSVDKNVGSANNVITLRAKIFWNCLELGQDGWRRIMWVEKKKKKKPKPCVKQ